jgi:hypothetical protein
VRRQPRQDPSPAAIGGTLSDFHEVEGFMLPFRVEAGNMFGTEAYFLFFRIEVTAIQFPG